MNTIKVTNMTEMFTALNMNPDGFDTSISIDDIDDDMGHVSLYVNNAITPEKLDQLKNEHKT